MENKLDTINTIEKQLENYIGLYHRLALANYAAIFFLYGIAVGASVLSTLFAATGFVTRGYLAALTAIPGVVLLINNAFKFNARSQWH